MIKIARVAERNVIPVENASYPRTFSIYMGRFKKRLIRLNASRASMMIPTRNPLCLKILIVRIGVPPFFSKRLSCMPNPIKRNVAIIKKKGITDIAVNGHSNPSKENV